MKTNQSLNAAVNQACVNCVQREQRIMYDRIPAQFVESVPGPKKRKNRAEDRRWLRPDETLFRTGNRINLPHHVRRCTRTDDNLCRQDWRLKQMLLPIPSFVWKDPQIVHICSTQRQAAPPFQGLLFGSLFSEANTLGFRWFSPYPVSLPRMVPIVPFEMCSRKYFTILLEDGSILVRKSNLRFLWHTTNFWMTAYNWRSRFLKTVGTMTFIEWPCQCSVIEIIFIDLVGWRIDILSFTFVLWRQCSLAVESVDSWLLFSDSTGSARFPRQRVDSLVVMVFAASWKDLRDVLLLQKQNEFFLRRYWHLRKRTGAGFQQNRIWSFDPRTSRLRSIAPWNFRFRDVICDSQHQRKFVLTPHQQQVLGQKSHLQFPASRKFVSKVAPPETHYDSASASHDRSMIEFLLRVVERTSVWSCSPASRGPPRTMRPTTFSVSIPAARKIEFETRYDSELSKEKLWGKKSEKDLFRNISSSFIWRVWGSWNIFWKKIFFHLELLLISWSSLLFSSLVFHLILSCLLFSVFFLSLSICLRVMLCVMLCMGVHVLSVVSLWCGTL